MQLINPNFEKIQDTLFDALFDGKTTFKIRELTITEIKFSIANSTFNKHLPGFFIELDFLKDNK